MDLKYYVLGKKGNPMLLSYLEMFYQRLLGLLSSIQSRGILEPEISTLLNKDNRDFIMNPDISSLINYLYLEEVQGLEQELGDVLSYQELLGREIRLFLTGEESQLSQNQGVQIAGTQIRLTTIDNNPYNQRDAHPDHKGNGGVIGWGEASEQKWLEIYEKTFSILKQADEGVYDELNQIIKKIIPLGTARGVHNSASYKECIGHLYMGYTLDSGNPEINNLEAIIHESSHNKLNLIMQFDPLVLNSGEEVYYSPYRPDARHMHGVYLGVHAITATVYVLLSSYERGLLGKETYWLEKALLFHVKNSIGVKALEKYLRPTPLGIEIFDEIKYVISLSNQLLKQISPGSEILQRVKQRQMEHFMAVNKNYPLLKY